MQKVVALAVDPKAPRVVDEGSAQSVYQAVEFGANAAGDACPRFVARGERIGDVKLGSVRHGVREPYIAGPKGVAEFLDA